MILSKDHEKQCLVGDCYDCDGGIVEFYGVDAKKVDVKAGDTISAQCLGCGAVYYYYYSPTNTDYRVTRRHMREAEIHEVPVVPKPEPTTNELLTAILKELKSMNTNLRRR